MLKGKKFQKSLLAVSLVLAMLLGSMTGCGKAGGESSSSTDEKASGQEKAEKSTEEKTSSEQESGKQEEAVSSEPFTIQILTNLASVSTQEDANNLYIFRYLEYYLKQKGYDVTLNVEAMTDPGEQLSLLLNSGDLPDVIWGDPGSLSNVNAVKYGAEEGMLLDWTPYINDAELMPNVNELTQTQPAAFLGATCTDGNIYALPYIDERTYGWNAGNIAVNVGLLVNKNWVDECGLTEPTTAEEFIDVMRAFQAKKKADGGNGVVYMGSETKMERYLWTALGYYGSDIGQFGIGMAIKDGQVWMPAATEDYRDFVGLMHTMYEEGLLSQDYFTLDYDTVASMIATLEYPVVGLNYLNVEDTAEYNNWIGVPAITAGSNDTVLCSTTSNVNQGCIWVSADTEHPEAIAEMVDFVYGKDGYQMMKFGPKEGEDPLGLVDGWYVGEDGMITTKLVADGTYPYWDNYAYTWLLPNAKQGCSIGDPGYARNPDGSAGEMKHESYTDALTGEEIQLAVKNDYSIDIVDGTWRLRNIENWAEKGHVTTVRLPDVFLESEDLNRVTELNMLLTDHITAESVNFITGVRPLSELDQYFEELKNLGVEEYIEIYRNAYADYMEQTFN